MNLFVFNRRKAEMPDNCPKCNSLELDYEVIWKKNELRWWCIDCGNDWWT